MCVCGDDAADAGRRLTDVGERAALPAHSASQFGSLLSARAKVAELGAEGSATFFASEEVRLFFFFLGEGLMSLML